MLMFPPVWQIPIKDLHTGPLLNHVYDPLFKKKNKKQKNHIKSNRLSLKELLRPFFEALVVAFNLIVSKGPGVNF